MPAISNVNRNSNTSNNTKLSSKLTFSEGEKFSGKVISVEGNNEVQVKLNDGWQFKAEIDDLINISEQALTKFEVTGYENGKIQLKVLSNPQDDSEVIKDTISKLVNDKGLDKSDSAMLKAMADSGIPLTKDNISFVKSLIQFQSKINDNPDEIDKFINNYLQGKNIDPSTEEGAAIKETLTQFFSSFKNMSSKDLMFFIENNIEFTKENIDSFNKLFNSNTTLDKYLENIKDTMENFQKEAMQDQTNSVSNNKNIENVAVKDISYDIKNISKVDIKNELVKILDSKKDNFTGTDFAKISEKINNLSQDKLINLVKENGSNLNSTLKQILGSDIKLSSEEINKLSDMVKLYDNKTEITNVIKDIVQNNESNISSQNLQKVFDKIDNNKEFLQKVMENVNDKESLNKELSKLTDTDIKLTNKEYNLIKNVVNNIKNSNSHIKNNEQDILNLKSQINQQNKDTVKDMIRDSLIDKTNNIKETVQDLINLSKDIKLDNSSIMQYVKANISDFKLFNNVSNEYYYLDIPVANQGTEYPCKLIVKDNRKGGKKIDRNNVKLVVSIKTINLGSVDGYLNIRDNSIDVNLKCNEDIVDVLDYSKQKLIDSLSTLGLIANIRVGKKDQDVNISSCSEFFNNGNNTLIDTTV